MVYLKDLEKQEQAKHQISSKQEIIEIKAEMNEI